MFRSGRAMALGLCLILGPDAAVSGLLAQAPDTVRGNAAADRRRAEYLEQQDARRRQLEWQRAGESDRIDAPGLHRRFPALSEVGAGWPEWALASPWEARGPFGGVPGLAPFGDWRSDPGWGGAPGSPFGFPPGGLGQSYLPPGGFGPSFFPPGHHVPGFGAVPIHCSGFVSSGRRGRWPGAFPGDPFLHGRGLPITFFGHCRFLPFSGFHDPFFGPFPPPLHDPFFGPPLRPGRPEHRFRRRFPIASEPAEPIRPQAAVAQRYVGAPGYGPYDGVYGGCAFVRIRTVTGAEYRGILALPAYGAETVRDVVLAVESELARGGTVVLTGGHGYPVYVPPSIFLDGVSAAPCGAGGF